MLPPEQPASTQAPLMSAATRVFESRNRDRESDIMPIQFWPERKLPPTALSPPSKITANSRNWWPAVPSHYGRNMEIKGLVAGSGPKVAQAQHGALIWRFLTKKSRTRACVSSPGPPVFALHVLAGGCLSTESGHHEAFARQDISLEPDS